MSVRPPAACSADPSSSAPRGSTWEPAQSGRRTSWRTFPPALTPGEAQDSRRATRPGIALSESVASRTRYGSFLGRGRLPPRPCSHGLRKESVSLAVVSSSLESQAVPWGPSPHCQHGSSTPVLSRVSGDTPRGLGKETLKAAIGTSLRVSPVRGKTASSSSCLASKHTWNSDDCRHPGHVPQVTGQPLTYPTRGQAGCKDRALKVCFGPQGLMGTAVSLKCQRRDFYSGPQRPEIS